MFKPEFSNEFMSEAVGELNLDKVNDTNKLFLEKKLGPVEVKSVKEARRKVYDLLLDPEYGFDDLILGEGFEKMYEKLIKKTDKIISSYEKDGINDAIVTYYYLGESNRITTLIELINVYNVKNNSSVEEISNALTEMNKQYIVPDHFDDESLIDEEE